MTERMDHARAAVEMLKDAQVAKDLATVAVIADGAHVHATLALVEQQRISNLIALFTASQDAENVGGAIADFANEIWDHMADEPIRAALGLTAGQEGETE